jgi:aerobic-type carbon monoxide dehydrogenase small subunit (CoxS/CutS family)
MSDTARPSGEHEAGHCTIWLDGERRRAPIGASVAAALALHGWRGTRTSVSGEPRAALCGMGICFECRVAIDGVPLRRACLVTVREGLEVSTRHA